MWIISPLPRKRIMNSKTNNSQDSSRVYPRNTNEGSDIFYNIHPDTPYKIAIPKIKLRGDGFMGIVTFK
jgi:hypothetical protein